ncbi:hypothetical protein GCM10017673_22820 [Streptosporangium violaceochromogenes]|nr:hypothetical protein GCM10017673_22820 [Streptosporangium violaceochromogenes]
MEAERQGEPEAAPGPEEPDPPTDPFAAVSLPSLPVRPGARDPNLPPGRRARGGSRLPPGVSPDIMGSPGANRPVMPGSGTSSLPPLTAPPQPWKMPAPVQRPPQRRPSGDGPPYGMSGVNGPGGTAGSGGAPGLQPPSYDDPVPHRGRRVLLTLLLLLLAAGLVYTIPAIVMSGKMLPGTRVNGVDIGGLTATEAADRLRERLAGDEDRKMVLRAAGEKYALDPSRAGLEFDVVATIEQAPSDFPAPAEVWRALTGTTELSPKVSVDTELMGATVEALAKKIDRRVREGAVVFKGTRPVAVIPRDGLALEEESAAEAIADAFLSPGAEVDLPVSVIKPKVTADTVRQTAARAGKALSGPITLTHAGRRVPIPVGTLAAHLSFVPDGTGGMRPEFDAAKALTVAEKRLVDQALAPREPTFEIVAGRPRLVPGRRGRGIDRAGLAQAVARVISEGGGRTIPVTLTTVRPRLSDAQARGLGVKEKISEFTTPYDCCPPRVTNIRTLARILDGHLVLPGETFSLNGVIGRRDTARGFVPAPMIQGGRLVDSVGGGISQFVTTMYNAVFFGGLEDVQHVAHEFYISRYPAGRESTVSWPEPDFRWRNDSKYGVLVKTSTSGGGVTVAFWSTKRYDIESISSPRYDVTPFTRATAAGPGCIPMTGQQGFTIDVTRVFRQGGREVRRETKKTVYRPETDLKCVSNPATTPTTTSTTPPVVPGDEE